MSEEKCEGERILRKMLWLHHGALGHILYGDDGQMQCATCQIDFLNNALNRIDINVDQALKEMYEVFKKESWIHYDVDECRGTEECFEVLDLDTIAKILGKEKD